MAKTDFKSVDEYLRTLPENVQAMLERVRRAIRKAVPRAEEEISYQIPTFKLHGVPVLYFAGWQKHYSIYPATDGVVATFAEELAAYELSRGTIRFPLSEPVPVGLIARIAKMRAREATALIAERAARSAKKPASNAKKPKRATKGTERTRRTVSKVVRSR